MKLIKLLIAMFWLMIERQAIIATIGQTGTGDVSAETDAYYDRTQIQPLRESFVFGRFAQKKKLPKNSGNNVIRWNKWPVMATQMIPLTEGVNPDPQKSSKTVVEATALLYGGYVEITEDVELYREDPIATMYQERMGWQSADTLDELTRDELISGSNVVRSDSVAARTDIDTKILIADLKKAARTLRNNKVPYFKKQIGGSSKIGTTPIQNAWVMITHGDVVADLEEMATGVYKWVPVSAYPDQTEVDVAEKGSVGPFRVCETTMAKVWANGGGAIASTGLVSTGGSLVDVYASICMGPDGLGCVDVADGMKSIRKSKEQIGGPLELYSTIGWKARFVPKIIDGARIVRVESGATA